MKKMLPDTLRKKAPSLIQSACIRRRSAERGSTSLRGKWGAKRWARSLMKAVLSQEDSKGRGGVVLFGCVFGWVWGV